MTTKIEEDFLTMISEEKISKYISRSEYNKYKKKMELLSILEQIEEYQEEIKIITKLERIIREKKKQIIDDSKLEE